MKTITHTSELTAAAENTRPTHILWAVYDRHHWSIAFTGTHEECEKEQSEMGEGYEIHANEVRDSWNNAVTGIHYDTYMDNSTDSRAMTAEEIERENAE